MKGTHSVHVPLAPQLSKQASQGHILNGLKTGSLISIAKLCDDDCAALFTKYSVKIFKNGMVIILGLRNVNSGLWSIPLSYPLASPAPNSPHTATK